MWKLTASGPARWGVAREAMFQELLNSFRGRCNLFGRELFWAVYNKLQPTLDRLDYLLPDTIGNVDGKCLRCNRARGSLGIVKTKKKSR